MDGFAHVKWFVTEAADGISPVTVAEYLAVLAFVFLGLMLLATATKAEQYKKLDKLSAKRLRPYSNWVPTVVRISTGLMILINVWQDYVLAPNITNSGTEQNIVAVSILTLSAILLLSGLFVRSAAVILLIGYFSALLSTGFLDSLDHLEYLAIAAYLFLSGPGELRFRIKGLDDKPSTLDQYKHLATPLYISLTGATLSVLAFSEKIFNLNLAQSFLNQYHWNFMEFAGVSDRYFILFIGAVELIIGLSFVLNIATKLTSLIVLMTMIATAVLLGVSEIVGHLFAVGLLAAIWIPGPKPKKA